MAGEGIEFARCFFAGESRRERCVEARRKGGLQQEFAPRWRHALEQSLQHVLVNLGYDLGRTLMLPACAAQEFAGEYQRSGVSSGNGGQLCPGGPGHPEPLRQRIALLGVECQRGVVAQCDLARRDKVEEFARRSVLPDEQNLVLAIEQGNEFRERPQAFACAERVNIVEHEDRCGHSGTDRRGEISLRECRLVGDVFAAETRQCGFPPRA